MEKSKGPHFFATSSHELWSKDWKANRKVDWVTMRGGVEISRIRLGTYSIKITAKVELNANWWVGCKCINKDKWIPDYLIADPKALGSLEAALKADLDKKFGGINLIDKNDSIKLFEKQLPVVKFNL